MKRILLTLVMLLCMAGVTMAGDWKFNIMGINPSDFKGRDWKVIVAGAVASLAVHEIGHWVVAESHDGGDIHWLENRVTMYNYGSASHTTQQMFRRGGFLGQLVVGGVLTAIPKTRHSDFSLGFNGFTCANTALYVATGGLNENTSDIKHLDHGVEEGILYSVGAGALTYINLNKEKE